MSQPAKSSSEEATALICPACGGVNTEESVFCANPACHKALGEFKYVLEELSAGSTFAVRVADKVTNFVAQPHFVTVHVAWFGLWVALNSGAVALVASFDQYPYSLLGIILSIEAILITSFLLISNNRQSAHANKRAELDYEVNVKSYRQLLKVTDRLEEVCRLMDGARLERLGDKRS